MSSMQTRNATVHASSRQPPANQTVCFGVYSGDGTGGTPVGESAAAGSVGVGESSPPRSAASEPIRGVGCRRLRGALIPSGGQKGRSRAKVQCEKSGATWPRGWRGGRQDGVARAHAAARGGEMAGALAGVALGGS